MSSQAVIDALNQLKTDAESALADGVTEVTKLSHRKDDLQLYKSDAAAIPYLFTWNTQPADSGNPLKQPGDLCANDQYMSDMAVHVVWVSAMSTDPQVDPGGSIVDEFGDEADARHAQGKPIAFVMRQFGESTGDEDLTLHIDDATSAGNAWDRHNPWNEAGIAVWKPAMEAFIGHYVNAAYARPHFFFFDTEDVATVESALADASQQFLDWMADARASTVEFEWDPTGQNRTLAQIVADTDDGTGKGIDHADYDNSQERKNFVRSVLKMSVSWAMKQAAYDVIKATWPEAKCSNWLEQTNTFFFPDKENDGLFQWYTAFGDFWSPVMYGIGTNPLSYTHQWYPWVTDNSKPGAPWIPLAGQYAQDVHYMSKQIKHLVDNFDIAALLGWFDGSPTGQQWDESAISHDVAVRSKYQTDIVT